MIPIPLPYMEMKVVQQQDLWEETKSKHQDLINKMRLVGEKQHFCSRKGGNGRREFSVLKFRLYSVPTVLTESVSRQEQEIIWD